MNNFYEITTIVLGCVVIAQYIAGKKRKYDMQKFLYMLDRVANRDWAIERTGTGYTIVDEDGDILFRVKDNSRG